MGIRSPESFTYKSEELKWKHIIHLSFELASEGFNKYMASQQIKAPVIDIDTNQLCYKYVGVTTRNCADKVIGCAKVGRDEGLEMNITVDSEKDIHQREIHT